jgi:hypothetical protein
MTVLMIVTVLHYLLSVSICNHFCLFYCVSFMEMSWLILKYLHLISFTEYLCKLHLLTETRPKPSDFSGEKTLSMPSFGGEVKLSVPCCSFAACKKPLQFPWKSHCWLNLIGYFSPIIPPFADRGLSLRRMWNASGDDGRN